MANNILIKGKGLITKIALSSVNGVNAFTGKKNKRVFVDVLKEAANENVVLVAYCILDSNAHFIIKSNSASDVDAYVSRVISDYASLCGGTGRRNPLRSDFISQRIKGADLDKAVAYIHSLAPTNPFNYEFCSYAYLREGIHGGTGVIVTECGDGMTEEDFYAWLDRAAGRGYKTFKSGKERFSAVLKEDKQRYLVGQVTEDSVVYVIADLCERTGAKYKKSARAIGISYKERRDIMIAVLIELARRGHGFSESIAIMKIFKENRHDLLLDCIVEENRANAYSYDHIINSLGIDDFYYDILAEIIRGLHRKYQYNFEELCQKFHLQNDIIALRHKCGF